MPPFTRSNDKQFRRHSVNINNQRYNKNSLNEPRVNLLMSKDEQDFGTNISFDDENLVASIFDGGNAALHGGSSAMLKHFERSISKQSIRVFVEKSHIKCYDENFSDPQMMLSPASPEQHQPAHTNDAEVQNDLRLIDLGYQGVMEALQQNEVQQVENRDGNDGDDEDEDSCDEYQDSENESGRTRQYENHIENCHCNDNEIEVLREFRPIGSWIEVRFGS